MTYVLDLALAFALGVTVGVAGIIGYSEEPDILDCIELPECPGLDEPIKQSSGKVIRT